MDLRNRIQPKFDPFIDGEVIEEERSEPKKEYNKKIVGAASAVLFFIGVGIGSSMSPPTPVDDARPEPAPTVTVTATATHVTTVPADLPESCKNAIATLLGMREDLNEVIGSSGKQVDILRQAHTAIATKDLSLLNDAHQKQNDLVRSVSSSRLELLEQQAKLDERMAKCKTELTG